jgi:formate dehydrogenase major subunit
MANKEKGKYPFIMKMDGVATIFGPGMVDGPFQEYYEPLVKNPMSGQFINLAIEIFKSDLDKVARASERYPHVCTTYSCTEHWCAGALTRWQAWLLEAIPEVYVEICEKLTKEKGILNGARVKVS